MSLLTVGQGLSQLPEADHIPWLMVHSAFKANNCRLSPSQVSHLSDLSYLLPPASLLPLVSD